MFKLCVGTAHSPYLRSFYCPLDKKVYLDTSSFQDLERRFRACDAAAANKSPFANQKKPSLQRS
ncbi:MAG: neutral zinc metallopeptidase [Pseudolabrys sp.]